MTKSVKKIILVVDPAIRQPEVTAFNNLEEILDSVRSFDGMGNLSIRYWLPAIGQEQALGSFFRANPSVDSQLVGCISLGSYANVTDLHLYPWVSEFSLLLDRYLGPRSLPFLGICFAHQFLAARHGWTVNFVKDRKWPEMSRSVVEKRRVDIISPRLQLLFRCLPSHEWNDNSSQAVDYKRVLQALKSKELSQRGLDFPLSATERSAARVLAASPNAFDIWTRHEQWVVCPPNGETKRSPLVPAATNSDFIYDGLVHNQQPWFTLQGHPEQPMTDSSQIFLRNFMLLCGS